MARMVRVILRDQDQEKLHKHSEELASALSEAVMKEGDQVRMKGPMPCAISRIAGYYRNQIVLLSPRASRLQTVLATVREQGGLAKSDRIAVTGNAFSDTSIGEGKTKRPIDQDPAGGIVLEGTSDVAISGNLFSGLKTDALTLEGATSRRVLFGNNVLSSVKSGDAGLAGSHVSDNLP